METELIQVTVNWRSGRTKADDVLDDEELWRLVHPEVKYKKTHSCVRASPASVPEIHSIIAKLSTTKGIAHTI
eukprot:2597153-Rhodomonas_salina.1